MNPGRISIRPIRRADWRAFREHFASNVSDAVVRYFAPVTWLCHMIVGVCTRFRPWSTSRKSHLSARNGLDGQMDLHIKLLGSMDLFCDVSQSISSLHNSDLALERDDAEQRLELLAANLGYLVQSMQSYETHLHDLDRQATTDLAWLKTRVNYALESLGEDSQEAEMRLKALEHVFRLRVEKLDNLKANQEKQYLTMLSLVHRLTIEVRQLNH